MSTQEVCHRLASLFAEHSFDIKTSIGKTGAMKGKKRETVTLQLGNYNFRKRFVLKNGNINFTCTGCEGQVPKVNLSALAKINEEGKYELLYWPRSKEHSCWADQTDALIAKARREMYVQLSENPSRSVNQIYESVRTSFTQNMEDDLRMLFLEKFPKLKNIAPALYRKRREFIPADPKTQTDLNLESC